MASNPYWNSTTSGNGVLDGELIPDAPSFFRFLIGNTATIFASEHHTFPTTTNIGAYHQPGSAVLLTGTTRPTTRLDASAFDVNDNGRLFYDSDTENLEVLTAFGGPTWISYGSLSAANTWAAVQTFSEVPVFTKAQTTIEARNTADDGNVTMMTVDGSDNPTLPDGVLATTQSASDNSTKVATTEYTDAQATAGLAALAFGTPGTKNSGGSVNMVKDSVYKAQQDGFITAWSHANNSDETRNSHGFIGSTSSPTIPVASNSTPGNPGKCSITFSVKKDWYFKVEQSDLNVTSQNIYWHPVGSYLGPILQ